MSDTVKKVEYFHTTVSDKPGESRRLLEHLSEKGVNLMAFNAFPIEGGWTRLDFFPDNVDTLKSAVTEAGLDLEGPKKAFLIQGDDRIGALHQHHLVLGNAGVNVLAANGVVDGLGRFGYLLWVRSKDYEKAADALRL